MNYAFPKTGIRELKTVFSHLCQSVKSVVQLLPFPRELKTVFFCLLFIPLSTQAGDEDLALSVAGYWGGPVTDVDIHGDLAYVANGRVLRILDISDESHPVQIGALALDGRHGDHATAADVTAVRVRGQYAFIGRGHENHENPLGISVADVSNPAAPFWVADYAGGGFGNLPRGAAKYVHVHGDYAYVDESQLSSAQGATTWAYDISDPENPVLAGNVTYGYPAGSNLASAVRDGKLYITHDLWDDGPFRARHRFAIYDLDAHPVQPPRVGELLFDDIVNAIEGYGLRNVPVADIALAGDYAYLLVAAYETTSGSPVPEHGFRFLLIVDISDPAQPALANYLDLEFRQGWLPRNEKIAVAAGRLYITEGPYLYSAVSSSSVPNQAQMRGLMVFDIATDPADPQLLSTQRPYGTQIYGALAAGNDRVYLWDAVHGLVIVDTSNPLQPQRLGAFHSPTDLLSAALTEQGYLLVNDAWGGFTVLDVDDPYAPRAVASYRHQRLVGGEPIEAVNHGTNFTVEDGRAYLTLGQLGMEIVDISDPLNPAFLGAYRHWVPGPLPPPFPPEVLREIYDVAVRGGHAVASARAGTHLNLDVSDPTAPALLSSFTFSGTSAPAIGVVALLEDGDTAVYGSQRSRANTGTSSGSMSERYIGGATTSAPFLQGTQDPRFVSDVTVDGSLLYVTREWSVQTNLGNGDEPGLTIRDVSNPAAPVLLARINVDNPLIGCAAPFSGLTNYGRGYAASAVDVQNGRAYVTNSLSRGYLSVLDVSDPTQPVCVAQSHNPYIMSPVHVGGVLVDEPRVYLTSNQATFGSVRSAFGLSVVLLLDTSVPPTATVQPGSLTLQLPQGGTAVREVSIRNAGNQALAWNMAGPDDAFCDAPQNLPWLSVAPMISSVPPQGMQTVTAVFHAAGLAPGDYSATLCLDSNDPAQPRLPLPVALTVEAGPALQVTPATLDFGELAIGESSGDLAAILANNGSLDAEITALDALIAPFEPAAGDCPPPPFQLAPGQSCELRYRFAPASPGNFEQALNITGNAATAVLTLQGTGLSAPAFDLLFRDRFQGETE